jgi:hypothetical protein
MKAVTSHRTPNLTPVINQVLEFVSFKNTKNSQAGFFCVSVASPFFLFQVQRTVLEKETQWTKTMDSGKWTKNGRIQWTKWNHTSYLASNKIQGLNDL